MMQGNGRRYLRIGAIVLGLGGAVAAFGTQARAAEENTEHSTQLKQVALVKIEIKDAGGKVLKNDGDIVDWNADANLVIDAEDSTHGVALKLGRESERANKINVTLAYDVDGQPVVAPHSFNTRLKKREVIRVEGGLAIAVTVTPATVEVEPPKKPREKIQGVVDPNDPLDGL